MRDIASGANVVVVKLPYPGGTGLGGNGGGKVGLVKRRTDARTEVDDKVGWRNAKLFLQERDRASGDVEFRAGTAGMDEANGAAVAIGDIDCGTVGDIDAENKTGHVGDERIGAGMDLRRASDGDAVAMDLLGAGEAVGVEAFGTEGFGMGAGETRQGGLAVGHDIDAGNAGQKGSADFIQLGQRLENGRHVAGISGF